MQPTTNNQSSFNPLSIIAPGNGSIKGPTGDPDDGSGTGQCSIILPRATPMLTEEHKRKRVKWAKNT
ncbi:hypothetical protein G9A89_004938 [Geosiphon pyriformis]|nr:hypothetical protein G9A89_004938 [Geosiphon pyriformis]